MKLTTESLRLISNCPDGPPEEKTRCAVDRAMALVQTDPEMRLRVFADDWMGVDAMRDRIRAIGLSDRISVHYLGALRWTNLAK